jgi:plastocyanin
MRFHLKQLGIASLTFLVLITVFSAKPVEAKVTVAIVVGASSNQTTPGYSPQTITVVIGVNNTVTWVNNDNALHTVTSDAKAFDSGPISSGHSFTLNFTTVGQFQYHCTFHSWMHGTVLVKAGAPVSAFPVSPLALVLIVTVIVVGFGLVGIRKLRTREHTGAFPAGGSNVVAFAGHSTQQLNFSMSL